MSFIVIFFVSFHIYEVVIEMKKWLIFCLVLFIIITVSSVTTYMKLIPTIKEYGKMEVDRFNQLIVSHCYFTKESQYNDLVIIERNEQGEIQLIDFDMIKVNTLANHIVMDIENTYLSIENGQYKPTDNSYYQRRLKEVSDSGIVSKISMTSLLHLPFFKSFMPCIQVRYKHLSYVGSSIIKSIENYGVNHVMVELAIEITMNLTMVYPFFEQYHSHKIKIPVLLEIFQGQVPLVYSR